MPVGVLEPVQSMHAFNRPAYPQDLRAINQEFFRARKGHHCLLEFEDRQQALLDEVLKEIDPEYVRLGFLVSKLQRRFRKSSEDLKFARIFGTLKKRYEEQRPDFRAKRNKDPRWIAALAWANEPVAELKVQRRATKVPFQKASETFEQYQARLAKIAETRAKKSVGTSPRTRREQFQVKAYNEESVRSDTWNDLIKRVKTAVAAVLKVRREGKSASWRHPRWYEGHTLVYKAKSCQFTLGTRLVKAGSVATEARYLRVAVRAERKLRGGGIRGAALEFEVDLADASFELSQIKEVRLSRTKRTRLDATWRYQASIVLNVKKDVSHAAREGYCGIDVGHREYGHEGEGLRVAYWYGSDGVHGQILLPVRAYLNRAHALQADLDLKYNARQASLSLKGNRHSYRRDVLSRGVCTQEEASWLAYEHLTEKQIAKARRKVEDVRQDIYAKAARELSKRYAVIGVEDLKASHMRTLDTAAESSKRKRQNRDVAAPYLLKQICERSGAAVRKVDARRTSQVCPHCSQPTGKLDGLMLVCPSCGLTYDRDFGAAKEICRRLGEALANLGVSTEYPQAAQ